mgnify:FL=1
MWAGKAARRRVTLPDVAGSFLWYDLETFGTDPRWDRIAQFAAVRTDMNLQEIAEPVVLHGRISPDYLPAPEACMVTGLTPKRTAEGLVEAQLAEHIYAEMAQPGTCSAGFNSIRFDDEFIRNLFYRNFIDPYRREWDRGNSRWDLLPLLRLAHDLRPSGMEWLHDGERPVFRLEELSSANGVAHDAAHDALSDVRATIGLARRLREAQPRLFDFYLELRRKDAVRRIVNLQNREPVLFSDPLFTRAEGTTSMVLPLTAAKNRSNEIIAFDLRSDPHDLMEADADELRRRVFSSRNELAEGERIPLVRIAVNRVPAVAPRTTLTAERAAALSLDLPAMEQRAAVLRSRLDEDPALAGRIRALYDDNGPPAYRDVDLNLYAGGFFGDEDRTVFERIRGSRPEDLISSPPVFADARGSDMLFRYLGRNYPEALPPDARRRWQSHCAGRLLAPEYDGATDLHRFRTQITTKMQRTDIAPRDKTVLRDLRDYADWLERHILHGA